MKLRYQFDSDLALPRVSQILEGLLANEGVASNNVGTSLRSTNIPQPILGFDRRLYSRRKPVGLNPFVFFDQVTFDFGDTDGRTQIQMHLGLKRALMWAIAATVLLVAVAMRAPVGITLLLAAMTTLGASLFLYAAFAMAKREVRDCLTNGLA